MPDRSIAFAAAARPSSSAVRLHSAQNPQMMACVRSRVHALAADFVRWRERHRDVLCVRGTADLLRDARSHPRSRVT